MHRKSLDAMKRYRLVSQNAHGIVRLLADGFFQRGVQQGSLLGRLTLPRSVDRYLLREPPRGPANAIGFTASGAGLSPNIWIADIFERTRNF